jgi:diaminopimelate decarboxylase
MLDKIEHYPYLSYKNNKLLIQQTDIETLSGSKESPFFLFLPDRFKDNVSELKNKLGKSIPNLFISYAAKANYLGRILQHSNQLGLGVEVMSLFELKLAEKAGISFDKIVLNGPAKTSDELNYAITSRIGHLNVESLNELKDIEKIAKKQKIVQNITVRIHPKLKESTERKLLIKKNSKLGIDFTRAIKLFEYAKKSPNLNPVGVHTHVGTNLTSHEFYDELLEFLNEYISDLETKLHITISEINLGGGLGSRSTLERENFQLEELGKQIYSKIDDIDNKKVIFEPGRYLIEDSFVAITKVLRTKKSWGRKWAFTDIGANTLIPMRYSHYSVIPAIDKGKGQYTNIGGPLCLPVDILMDEAVDFEIEEGDLLVVLNCGAYTLSMSEQFGYPRPAIFQFSEKGIELIKSADDLDQMVNDSFQFS